MRCTGRSRVVPEITSTTPPVSSLFSRIANAVTSLDCTRGMSPAELQREGRRLYEIGKQDKAFRCFQQCLALEEGIDPDSLTVARLHNNIGLTYWARGKLSDALECYQKSLIIREHLAPGSLDVAESYNTIGLVYHAQGRLSEALECQQKSLAIREYWAPNTSQLATSYDSIGMVYQEQGLFLEALEHYEKSLLIRNLISPNSLSVAASYNNIGTLHQDQKRFAEALGYHQKSIEIKKRLAPNSLSLAASYGSLGSVYYHMKEQSKALDYYHKSLRIRQAKAPDSLACAKSYSKLGMVYEAQGNAAKALESYQQCFAIRERLLIPQHPALLSVCIRLARLCLGINNYSRAIFYARKVMQSDPNYKYAYDVQGLALQGMQKWQEALDAFDRALACDRGYADAFFHKIALIKAWKGKEEAMRAVQTGEFAETDYDDRKRRELTEVTRCSSDSSSDQEEILPPVEYGPNAKELSEALHNLIGQEFARRDRQWQVNFEEHKARVNERVSNVEDRLDLLNGRVLRLSDSLDMVGRALGEVEDKLDAQREIDSPLSDKLYNERARLQEREARIRAFRRNPDQREYFLALLSELESAYLAAQIMESGRFVGQSDTSYQRAASYVDVFVKFIPHAGHLLSSLITGAARMADTYFAIRDENAFKRIRNLAPTVGEFDQIALRVAVQFTSERSQMLCDLREKKVPSDWETSIAQVLYEGGPQSNWRETLQTWWKGGMQEVMKKFLQDNETEAKVLGRLDAFKILGHLQGESIATNYADEEDDEMGKRRYSLIAEKIGEACLTEQHFTEQ